jgi:hypothetical protein
MLQRAPFDAAGAEANADLCEEKEAAVRKLHSP